MLKKDVIAFFGNQNKTADALGLSPVAVCRWGDIVPKTRQGHVRLAMEAEQKKRDEAAKKEARRQARKKAA